METTTNQPVTNVSTGKVISKTEAAERMFGTGSKQHLAAIKKYGK